MARAVGIDLGTTNSAVAVLEGGEPTIIANAEGGRTTPSVVAFSKSGEVLVGEIAKRQAVTNVERTIRSVKRHMGTDWKSPEIDGKKYTAQEISARILQKLKRDAEAYLGEKVTDAVITVPAYFDDHERQATKEAGEIAGLNVLRIINEPTAAALAYGLDKGKEDELILVFDLGGGTFDVSLLEVGKDPEDGFSTIQVRATNGDNQLGGDDWDERIVNHLLTTVKNTAGVDLSKDKIAMQRLRDAAEQAKKELSTATSTNLVAAVPLDVRERPHPPRRDAHPRAVRADDQGPARPHQGAVPPGHQGRRHQAVRHRPRGPRRRLDPHARRQRRRQGAHRRQGAQQGRQPGRGRRRRRVPAGRCPQGRAQGRPAHRRHAALPRHRDQGRPDDQAHRAQHRHPDQALRGLLHRRRQPAERADPGLPGRARDRAHNKPLGTFELAGIAPAPRGVPQIEVTFDIDANGIVHVSAKDRGTGKEQSITISGGSALAKEEIERMVKDAEAHAAEDRKRREETEARNTAEQLVYSTEKFLDDNADKVPADGRGAVDTALADLKTALKAGVRRECRGHLGQGGHAVRGVAEARHRDVCRGVRAGAAGGSAGAEPVAPVAPHAGAGSEETTWSTPRLSRTTRTRSDDATTSTPAATEAARTVAGPGFSASRTGRPGGRRGRLPRTPPRSSEALEQELAQAQEAVAHQAHHGGQPRAAAHPDTMLAAERLLDLQRLQAEYVNYKRRVDRDRARCRSARCRRHRGAAPGARRHPRGPRARRPRERTVRGHRRQARGRSSASSG